jgi:hypothetical protein
LLKPQNIGFPEEVKPNRKESNKSRSEKISISLIESQYKSKKENSYQDLNE